MTPQAFRLTHALTGVQLDGTSEHPVTVQLRPGTVVTLTGRPAASDLVNVEADGKSVTVFRVDLEDRSEQIHAGAHAS